MSSLPLVVTNIHWSCLIGVSRPSDNAVRTHDDFKGRAIFTDRKKWTSTYDPALQQKQHYTPVTLPNITSFPEKLTIVVNPRHSKIINSDIIPWITTMGLKFRQSATVRLTNGEKGLAYLFKNEKSALMFKLAWG